MTYIFKIAGEGSGSFVVVVCHCSASASVFFFSLIGYVAPLLLVRVCV